MNVMARAVKRARRTAVAAGVGLVVLLVFATRDYLGPRLEAFAR
ncbi:MAG TPA: hypothetical protein VHP61_09625 [Acidobacteriota bacterium]|nr:hypothetical protein [Acidobacteriota bacterium]